MTGKQLKKLEAELWKAADQLRANSKLTATEYSMPVLGLIFLRHAYNRFVKVKEEIEKNRTPHPQRGKKPITKNDFLEKNALYLPDYAQYDYLVNLPESKDIGEALDTAMKDIETEYEALNGVLPKNYSTFGKDLLRELLRAFNKEALQKAEGDVFGKIYEYFLNKFAMTGAQEGGEFFTPMSLVQTIVNVIEPAHGTIFDPAVGSAGMFVQTGYFLEDKGLQSAERVNFYGQEKTEMNTKLAKMNLAVHGLEGKIIGGDEANTYYNDYFALVGACDFVMANPPFNVDGVDKNKDVVKKDPRLLTVKDEGGKLKRLLPKNDNANYLWIQYFYGYLKPTGRAGFVMASSASDAGHSEKEIRKELVRTGAVDVMIAIGNNFFYTRSLPCTLWFFDRAKELDKVRKDKVLMLDARKIYRKVTSKINDFSPEQLQNLICIVNLYRGNNKKFETTVDAYLQKAIELAKETSEKTERLKKQIQKVHKTVSAFVHMLAKENKDANSIVDALKIEELAPLAEQQNNLIKSVTVCLLKGKAKHDFKILEEISHQCKSIRKLQDKVIKQLIETIANAQKELQLNKNKDWKELKIKEQIDELKELQKLLSGDPDEDEPGLLHETEYFWRQALWLKTRFPDGAYNDFEGLCKVVSQKEIEEKDWSLSPGRYVGVDAATDDDFDYEERLKEMHIELDGLNEEATRLVELISENYKHIV